jgi:hypothetical protein
MTPTDTPVGDCGTVTVSAAYPNPVSTDTVKFTLQTFCPKTVRWTVFSAGYRKIGEWIVTANGTTVVAWDLKDATGKRVASGLYYAVFIPEGGNRQVRSLVVLP